MKHPIYSYATWDPLVDRVAPITLHSIFLASGVRKNWYQRGTHSSAIVDRSNSLEGEINGETRSTGGMDWLQFNIKRVQGSSGDYRLSRTGTLIRKFRNANSCRESLHEEIHLTDREQKCCI